MPYSGRDSTLQARYRVTEAWYQDQLRTQGGRCALCFGLPKNRPLYVDHDHETGGVRGLLCSPCNALLGRLRAIPGGETAIANYLARGRVPSEPETAARALPMGA